MSKRLIYTRWATSCSSCGAAVPGDGAVLERAPTRAVCVPCWATPPAEPLDREDLYPYQRLGAGWLAGARAALLADEPGLGKTAQALVALAELGYPPALVVCPPSVRRQWVREANRWAPRYRAGAVETRKDGTRFLQVHPGELRSYGYTALRKKAPGVVAPGTVLLLDEAQHVKNPQAQQTKGVRELSERVLAQGGRVWLLTATPGYASASEVWQVCRAAELHRALHPSRTAWQLLGDEEQAAALARIMLRRRAQDELDLPPLRMETLTAEVGPVDRQRLTAAAKLAAARGKRAEEGEEAVGRAAAGMSESEARVALEQLLEEGDSLALATVRKLVAIVKTPRVLELAQDHEEAGSALVVFSDHRAPVLQLAERPGWGGVLGGQTPRERDELVGQFVAGELHGMGVVYAAGGTGLDGLQRRASRAVLLDLPWTPALVEQALGRLVRIGQTGGSILVSIVVADHWVDELITSRVRAKLETLEGLGIGLSMAGGIA